MNAEFHRGNRQRLYESMQPESLLVLFSGEEVRKTNDEFYPFYANRSFVYLTGLEARECVLLARKNEAGQVEERVYIQRPDAHAERWMGKRVKPDEAQAISAIENVAYQDAFPGDFHILATGGRFRQLYMDLYRASPKDQATPAHRFAAMARAEYPYLRVENADALIRKLRLIKQPCEIEAIREAEKITRDGILAMMRASRPGMYEYQYKAEFDHALGQHGPQGPAFPSIISAGQNNFCIHYYAYSGQAQDGDMILNDVGGMYDHLMTDVSRGWPCNGRYSERQKLLFECALATSNHLFSIIKPGMPMEDVDATIRRYNCDRLKDAGVLKSYDEIATYMWHGGSHHVGYDVHDVVERPATLAPGMVFCIDVGIYHEAWGIGFRLEDNCLVTPDGCENLSAAIPRTVHDIEDVMRHRR